MADRYFTEPSCVRGYSFNAPYRRPEDVLNRVVLFARGRLSEEETGQCTRNNELTRKIGFRAARD